MVCCNRAVVIATRPVPRADGPTTSPALPSLRQTPADDPQGRALASVLDWDYERVGRIGHERVGPSVCGVESEPLLGWWVGGEAAAEVGKRDRLVDGKQERVTAEDDRLARQLQLLVRACQRLPRQRELVVGAR